MYNDLTHETTDQEIEGAVRGMSIAQRLAEYNAATNKATKKFSSGAASYKQTVKALIWLRDELIAREAMGQDVTPEDEGPVKSNTISAAITKSWQDPEIRTRRATKNKVRVDGATYKSVRAAYVALGLPLKEHVKFRALLKEHGQATNHGMHWSIITKEEEE